MINNEELETILSEATTNVDFDFEVNDEDITLTWTGGDSDTQFTIPRSSIESPGDLRDEVLKIYDDYNPREEVALWMDPNTGDGLRGAPGVEDLVDEFQHIEDELYLLHNHLLDICNGEGIQSEKFHWEISIAGKDGKRSWTSLDRHCRREIIRFLKAGDEKGTIEW